MAEIQIFRQRPGLRVGIAVVQTLFFTLLAVLLVSLFVYSLTASSPLLGKIKWDDAARFAVSFWMTIFGGTVRVGTGCLSLMPGTLTFLFVFFLAAKLRKTEIRSWADVVFAAAVCAFCVGVAGAASRIGGPWWTAPIGAALIGAGVVFCCGWKNLIGAYLRFPSLPRALLTCRRLLRGFWILCLFTLLLALFTHFGAVYALHSLYRQGIFGSVGLILLQLLYLPDLLISAGAWILGAGIAVGGASSSVFAQNIGLLPGIPVFALIPADHSNLWPLVFIPPVFFFLLGLFFSFRRPSAVSLRAEAESAALGGVLCALCVGVLGCVARGAIGPGRMGNVGVNSALCVGVFFVFAVLPFLLASAAAHPVCLKTLETRCPKWLRPGKIKPKLPSVLRRRQKKDAEKTAEEGSKP